MKKIFFILSTIISVATFSQEKEAIWFTDYVIASEEAKATKRPLIMYLTGSDWCSPCKRLNADFFQSEDFIEKSNKVVLLKVDLPFREDIITHEQREKNQKINKKFNPNKSFPLLVAFDSKGKEIDRIASYSGEDTRYHFEFLDKVLKK